MLAVRLPRRKLGKGAAVTVLKQVPEPKRRHIQRKVSHNVQNFKSTLTLGLLPLFPFSGCVATFQRSVHRTQRQKLVPIPIFLDTVLFFTGTMPATRILFVCHGNICRSTMAQFLFLKLAADAGAADDFAVDSAATHDDEIGSDTYYETQRILLLHDIPFTPRAAWRITPADGAKWDYIIGMDSANLRDLKRIIPPQHHCRLSKLMAWDGQDRDISDPWYTRDFERTYTDVLIGCTALLQQLHNK